MQDFYLFSKYLNIHGEVSLYFFRQSLSNENVSIKKTHNIKPSPSNTFHIIKSSLEHLGIDKGILGSSHNYFSLFPIKIKKIECTSTVNYML